MNMHSSLTLMMDKFSNILSYTHIKELDDWIHPIRFKILWHDVVQINRSESMNDIFYNGQVFIFQLKREINIKVSKRFFLQFCNP